ncbi:MAG: DUF6538 domain-containing protein [Solirubrobacterales bacterium]
MAYFNVAHLVRRGGVFCFRMAVPRSLWSRFGLREIKGSLKTGDPFTARIRCRKLSNAFEHLIDKVRAMPDLTQDAIRGLIQSYFQRCLDNSEEIARLAPSDGELDIGFEVSEMQSEAQRLGKALATRNYDPFTEMEAREVLGQVGLSRAQVDAEQFDALCNGVLRARIEDRRILVAKLLGQYDRTAPADPLFAGMIATMPPLPGEEKAGERTLAVLADRYCEQKRDKEWVGKTYLDNRRVVNLVIDLVGAGRTVSSLGIEDVRKVRDTLEKLPGNYMKSKAMQGKTMDEVLAANHGKPLAPKTQDKYFTMFRSFLNWCIGEGYLATMPGPKLKITGVTKGGGKKDRHSYSAEQLEKLFASPLFTGCKSEGRRTEPGDVVVRDGKFWIPIIALYSGLRLGEIVQLLISDIKEEQGVPFFDIDKGEGEDDKQLKTWASVRRVPIHPKLIELGFLAHVDQQRQKNPKGRIFPDVKPGKDGYYSARFSKWFSRYAKAVEVKTPKTSFHSFRHNFKDALMHGGVTEEYSKAMMGHAEESVHDTYGSHLTTPLLRQAIERALIPVCLDHLKALT